MKGVKGDGNLIMGDMNAVVGEKRDKNILESDSGLATKKRTGDAGRVLWKK